VAYSDLVTVAAPINKVNTTYPAKAEPHAQRRQPGSPSSSSAAADTPGRTAYVISQGGACSRLPS